MSRNLYWEPIIPRGKSLPDSLKYIFRRHWGEPIDRILDLKDLDYLIGIRDALNDQTSQEVQKLIEAIQHYSEIRVWEQ